MAFHSKEKEAGGMPYAPSDESNPPPPYSSTQPQTQQYPPQQQQQYYQPVPAPSGYLDGAGGAYPPQQQYPQRIPSPSGYQNGANPANRSPSPAAFPNPQPRIFHMTRGGMTQRKGQLLEADNRTPAYELKTSYSAEWSSSKPNVEIVSAYTGQMVGTINFPMMTRRIELVINGRPVQLEYNGFRDRSYRFMSSIGPLKWASMSMMGAGVACTTERGEWLAKFDTSWLSVHGTGKLEIVNQNLLQGLVDELVVSGVAMLENDRRNMAAGLGAGSGAGAAAGAVG